jgi:hypothetical protein
MIAENYKIVPILASANVGATSDTDSINISGFHKATVIYTCGAFTGDGTFSFNSGLTNAAKTTAVKFRHALGSAAIGATTADVLPAWTAATTTAAITCTTKMVVCEIDLQQVSSAHKWLTGTIAATAGICHGVVILEARYKSGQSPTAV